MSKGKRRFRLSLSIRQKIIGSFLVVIIFFNFNGALNVYFLNENDIATQENIDVLYPSLGGISEFRLMVLESRMYIINWVNEPKEKQEKEALRRLHIEYPEVRDSLQLLKKDWESEEQKAAMDSVLKSYEIILRNQKKIMNELVEPDDYRNINTKANAQRILENDILTPISKVSNTLNRLYNQKRRESEKTQYEVSDLIAFLQLNNLIFGGIILIGGILWALIFSRNITRPIKYINNVFIKLGLGELPEDAQYKFPNDEIGEMAESADKLVNGLKETSLFAEKIGNGDYQASFKPLSDNDVLGNALIEMRDNLSRVAEEDRRRNWQNEGLANFSDILKVPDVELEQLSDNIISNLVKYVKANQGGLFIVQDTTEEEEPYMILTASYAWDKKKHIDRKVYKGDGLTGQVWVEQEKILINDVPQDYVSITSGLGEANPNSLLIVPLKLNEDVYGVVELASFNEFQDFEVDFVEKVAESIASAIASARIQEQTRLLLSESNERNLEIQTEREKVQNNMEKLRQSEAEIERTKRLYQQQEELLDASSLMIETDPGFKIIEVNQLAQIKLKYDKYEMIGMRLEKIFDSYTQIEEVEQALATGNKWVEFAYLRDRYEKRIRMKVSGTAIFDENDTISKYLFILHDINYIEI